MRALTWYSAVSVLLFGFILFHELGHALAAKSQGVVAEKIILFPLGGGAYIPVQPDKLWGEVFVYAAGPLANLVLAGVTLPLVLTQPDGELLLRSYFEPAFNAVLSPTFLQQLLAMTVVVNVILALANLLPAYPLDGGRILRALLRRPLGERRSTVIVTVLGVVIGIALLPVSYLLGDWLMAIGSLFIVSMSAAEFRSGWQRRRLAGISIQAVQRDAFPGLENRLYPVSTVAMANSVFRRSKWPVLPVHDGWNNLLGFVEATHLAEDAETPDAPLKGLFEPEFVTVHPQEDLLSVTEKIVDANVYGAAVYGLRGQLIGYVFTEDILKLLQPRWWRNN